MTKDCAELYLEFMRECTYYPLEDIVDTASDFREWLKKNEV
jgi:hypothetical protein